MLRDTLVVALLLSVFLQPTFAEKKRDWQSGTVRDSERSRYFAGTVGNSTSRGTAQDYGGYGTYQGSGTTSQTAVYRVYQDFVIEGQTHVYLAQQKLRWKWSKPANLTVNGPVQFAVEKSKLFVVDEDGKEHEMEIVKKVLKETKP